jgi:putative IMPACT (imprinted ancient) family translation regulator
LAQFSGKIVDSDYQAVVHLRVALPQAELPNFSIRLADFSRGALHLRRIGE